MLALSRRVGRSKTADFYLDCPDGTRIVISVLGVRGGTVRLGITAPIEYGITRPDAKCQPNENNIISKTEDSPTKDSTIQKNTALPLMK